MQTCSRCSTQSPDTEIICPKCGTDLIQFSEIAMALRKFQDNPRVIGVRLVVHEDACPSCQQLNGTYPKDRVPKLPVEGCAHENGCRCFYQPLLDEIFP